MRKLQYISDMGNGITTITLLIALTASFSYINFRWIKLPFEKNMIPILTWGALRGGISVALALSLPISMHSNEIVPITYIVVIFSILVQGLTIGKLVKKKSRRSPQTL